MPSTPASRGARLTCAVTWRRRGDGEGAGFILYDDKTNDVTVVQPNEDGSYWRKIVRNKMTARRSSAA